VQSNQDVVLRKEDLWGEWLMNALDKCFKVDFKQPENYYLIICSVLITQIE